MIFLHEFHGTAAIDLDAEPREVFELLVDVQRLPTWNECIRHVIDAPPHPLTAGDNWVVQMHAMGMTWPTRSHAIRIDRADRTFVHRSGPDNTNPSYTLWTWHVRPRGHGSTLAVTWSARPATFWRRLLLARARQPVLAREVQTSLTTIGHVLTPPVERPGL